MLKATAASGERATQGVMNQHTAKSQDVIKQKPELSEIGVSPMQSHRYQKLADIPEAVFESALEESAKTRMTPMGLKPKIKITPKVLNYRWREVGNLQTSQIGKLTNFPHGLPGRRFRARWRCGFHVDGITQARAPSRKAPGICPVAANRFTHARVNPTRAAAVAVLSKSGCLVAIMCLSYKRLMAILTCIAG